MRIIAIVVISALMAVSHPQPGTSALDHFNLLGQ